MANKNFIVHNGLTVGALTIDAATGDISTPGNVTISGSVGVSSISKNDSKIMINDSGTSSNVDIIVDGTRALVFTGNALLPNSDQTYDLGSASLQWRDVYVGPGSLYVNGQKVLQEDAGTIVFSADADQNISIETSGDGNIELDPTATGSILLKGPVQVQAGAYVSSSDGNPIGFSSAINVDTIASKTANTNLGLSAQGTGVVSVNDDLVVTGNLTVQGTATSLSVTTLSVEDNIVDISAETTGTPTNNAGIRVVRGDSAAVQLRWNETSDAWEYTNDGSTYVSIPNAGALGAASATSLTTSGNVSVGGSLLSDDVTASTVTVTGDAVISGNLTINGTTTTVNSTTVTVDDKNIVLADGAADSASADGAGITVTGANATFTYAHSGTKWTMNKSLDVTGTVTATAFSGPLTGAVTGNASTATTLQTPRNINGVSFNGSADITVTAAAGTLTGGTLASGVTASSLTSVGTLTGLTVSGAIVPNANASVNLGSTTAWWGTVYGVSTQAKYADLAENYQADRSYPAGTVLMFGGAAEVTTADADTKAVAGVVSSNPAHLMNGGLTGNAVVALALQGRVPTNVIGPIKKGDLLVSAGFGYAKANNNAGVGQVIGKALQDFNGAKGIIEVVVGRV